MIHVIYQNLETFPIFGKQYLLASQYIFQITNAVGNAIFYLIFDTLNVVLIKILTSTNLS